MKTEFQVPSPLVQTLKNYFVRYWNQQADGTWTVVDISLDNLRPNQIPRCRRSPSGCIIQNCLMATLRLLGSSMLNSGFAYGTKRWVVTLDHQCEILAIAMASNMPVGDVAVTNITEGRKSMLKLLERMMMSFCSDVGASTAHTWDTLSGSSFDDVQVVTRKRVDDPGRLPGVVICATTSFWLSVLVKRVFDFPRHENSRSEWDILSNGGLVQEMEHIANGLDPGNCLASSC